MSEETKLEVIPQHASQEIVDKAKRESHQWLNPETWRTMEIVARTFIQSGAMPKSMDTAPKLMVTLQAGKEAGLQPLEAVNSFYFVNGKVSLYGEMAIAQVMRAGHKVEWRECNEKTATCIITRGDNGAKNEVTFTMEMAKARGLTSNAVYTKYPENMLRFKAFHSCARFVCPDALHGVPIKEIMEAEYVEEPKKPVANQTMANNVTQAQNAKPIIGIKPLTSLEDAIKEPEEVIEVMPEEPVKPKKADKTVVENALDALGGTIVYEEKPSQEKPLSEGMRRMKEAANTTKKNTLL